MSSWLLIGAPDALVLGPFFPLPSALGESAPGLLSLNLALGFWWMMVLKTALGTKVFVFSGFD